MVNKQVMASALPQLHISPQEEAQLRGLRALLEHEVLTEYKEFLARHQRQVDTRRWSHVKSEGDMHAYKEKLDDKTHKDAYSPSNESAAPLPRPQAALALQSRLSRVLVTGSVTGTLDDVMLGYTFQNTESLRAHWACQNDFMEDNAVLAKLEGPTEDDPYRFLGATWSLRTFMHVLRHNRDSLSLSSTRLTTLASGERVAVAFHHPIEHANLPELREFSTIRVMSSFLRVFRQLDAGRVEVFILHYLDARGNASDSFHLQESLKVVVPSTNCFYDAGIRKKLLWLVRQRASNQTDVAIEPIGSGCDSNCDLCAKSLGGIFGSSGSTCNLCSKHVCSRCSVPQEIVVDTRTPCSITQLFSFCLQCFLSTKKLSALAIATDMALRHREASKHCTI